MRCSSCDETPKKKAVKSAFKAGKSVIKHFTDRTYDAFVTEDVKSIRLEHCNSCELLTTTLGMKQCSACSCFVEAKTSLRDQHCEHPNGAKWTEE